MILRPVAAAVVASVALSPFAASAAFATTYVSLPLAYRVKHAEVILVGTAEGLDVTGDLNRVFEIAVREVLKGSADRRVTVFDFYASGAAPFRGEADEKGRLAGVFFLVRDQDGGFRPLGFPSFAPISERGRVSTLLRMLADLKSFVDDPRVYDDADLVTYVGEAFTTPSIRCNDAGRIGESTATALRQPDAPRTLWRVKTTWSVRLRYDRSKTPSITIIDAGLDPAIAAAIGSETNRAFRHPYTGGVVFETLDLICHVDARWPHAVGRLKAAEAVRYLRGRLRSGNPILVTSALIALGAIHDGEAVGAVTPLLRKRDAKVVATAATFLVWAGDPAALPPLTNALKRAYQEPSSRIAAAIDTFACAVDQLGGAGGALPDFRRLATLGSGAAISALGRNGEPSDVDLLLELYGREPIYAHSALVNLVLRSNQVPEPWMKTSIVGEAAAQWRQWWAAHANNTRLVRAATPPQGDCWSYHPER